MPIVEVTLIEGPSVDQRQRLMAGITDLVVRELGVPALAVNVICKPVPASDWAHAGTPLSETLGS